MLSTVLSKRIELTERVKDVVFEVMNGDLERDTLDHDLPLFGGGLGLDSIDTLQLVPLLEKTFEVEMDRRRPAILYSVNAIVDFLLSQNAKIKEDD